MELFLSFKVLFSVRNPGRINAYDCKAFCTQLKKILLKIYLLSFPHDAKHYATYLSFLQVPFLVFPSLLFSLLVFTDELI